MSKAKKAYLEACEVLKLALAEQVKARENLQKAKNTCDKLWLEYYAEEVIVPKPNEYKLPEPDWIEKGWPRPDSFSNWWNKIKSKLGRSIMETGTKFEQPINALPIEGATEDEKAADLATMRDDLSSRRREQTAQEIADRMDDFWTHQRCGAD